MCGREQEIIHQFIFFSQYSSSLTPLKNQSTKKGGEDGEEMKQHLWYLTEGFALMSPGPGNLGYYLNCRSIVLQKLQL